MSYLKLAEAAGTLLCASSDDVALQRERDRAIRILAKGTSFLPTFIPSSSSELSAKGLLDEYARALSEAVRSRTEITKLWEILATTPFSVDYLTSDSSETWINNNCDATPEDYANHYEALKPLIEPMSGDSYRAVGHRFWEPRVFIGYVAVRKAMRVFCLPHDTPARLFGFSADRETITTTEIDWLSSVGFDLDSGTFPDFDLRDDGAGWKETNVSLLFRVHMTIIPDDDFLPSVRLELRGFDFAMPSPVGAASSLADIEEALASSDLEHTQVHWAECPGDSGLGLQVIYEHSFDPDADHAPRAIALLPGEWHESKDMMSWKCRDLWIEHGDCEEIWKIDSIVEWADDPTVYDILSYPVHCGTALRL